MVIVTVAPTGSGPQWQKSPYVPITPEEIAKEAVMAYNAGAAVAHIHVREPKTKKPYPDVNLYREVTERIRDECDMIIQLTTGGGGPYGISLEQRLCALELNPEFASLNVATMTFGDSIFLNPPDAVRNIAKTMLDRNIKPEVECYDVGHINLAVQLFKEGLLKEPIRFGLVLGVRGGIPASPENLLHMVKSLPENCRWNTIVVGGRMQFKLLTVAMVLGGDVRVGMEDNIYLEEGVLAKSNAELVAKIVRIAKELGLKISDPTEARKILGITK
jgi:3-keto-5-aminohexanoate cleavage enzyme